MKLEIKYLEKIIGGYAFLIITYLLMGGWLITAILTEIRGLMIVLICFSVAIYLVSLVCVFQARRIKKQLVINGKVERLYHRLLFDSVKKSLKKKKKKTSRGRK